MDIHGQESGERLAQTKTRVLDLAYPATLQDLKALEKGKVLFSLPLEG